MNEVFILKMCFVCGKFYDGVRFVWGLFKCFVMGFIFNVDFVGVFNILRKVVKMIILSFFVLLGGRGNWLEIWLEGLKICFKLGLNEIF